METKVVVYPKKNEIKAFFKSPKADKWGTFRDTDGFHLIFGDVYSAISYCESEMEGAKDRGNARTVWTSKPDCEYRDLEIVNAEYKNKVEELEK